MSIHYNKDGKVSYTLKSSELEFRLIKKVKKRWFLFTKVEYHIETDYGTMGPFNDKSYCYDLSITGHFVLKDCTDNDY